jgi:hypothetical protein
MNPKLLRRRRQENHFSPGVKGSITRHYLKKEEDSQCPVAHSYNSNYLEGRDQDDNNLKPAQGR